LKKIGFLLNHYDVHQVPHIVPYAFELSRLYDEAQVAILCSSREEADFARAIGECYGPHKCSIEMLDVPSWVRLIDLFVSKVAFARKKFVLSHNVGRLAQLDVLVVPEMTSLQLRKYPEFAGVKMIRTSHGAGDRPGGSLDVRINQFDLALLPGRKYAEALVEMGYLDAQKAVVAGYPKLEAMERFGIERKQLFDNGRPTVIYNPHHQASQSSWPRFGRAVLDYFYQSNDYNLIFAPHVLLFKRPWGKGHSFPGKYKSNDHVLIDLGSMSSIDMTYLRSADIYLGDVSSQVYEFLEEPRPCVFLNAHGVDWRDDPHYRQWRFGPVIDDVAKLDEALKEAVERHGEYKPVQVEWFEYTFERSQHETAAERGARVIAKLAGLAGEQGG